MASTLCLRIWEAVVCVCVCVVVFIFLLLKTNVQKVIYPSPPPPKKTFFFPVLWQVSVVAQNPFKMMFFLGNANDFQLSEMYSDGWAVVAASSLWRFVWKRNGLTGQLKHAAMEMFCECLKLFPKKGNTL